MRVILTLLYIFFIVKNVYKSKANTWIKVLDLEFYKYFIITNSILLETCIDVYFSTNSLVKQFTFSVSMKNICCNTAQTWNSELQKSKKIIEEIHITLQKF